MSWYGERGRHRLSRLGVKTSTQTHTPITNPISSLDELRQSEYITNLMNEYDEDLNTLTWKEIESKYANSLAEDSDRYSTHYTSPLGLSPEEIQMYEDEIAGKSKEEVHDIYKKWESWKKKRRSSSTYRIVSNIKYENYPQRPYFVVRADRPPPMFRWISNDEESVAKNRILGEVQSDGYVSEFPTFMTYNESLLKKPRSKRKQSSQKIKRVQQKRKSKNIDTKTLTSHEEKRIKEIEERKKAYYSKYKKNK